MGKSRIFVWRQRAARGKSPGQGRSGLALWKPWISGKPFIKPMILLRLGVRPGGRPGLSTAVAGLWSRLFESPRLGITQGPKVGFVP